MICTLLKSTTRLTAFTNLYIKEGVMSKRWNNAAHEEALKRRKRKKLERAQQKIEHTSMYGNQTNELSTKTDLGNNY